MCNPRPDLQRPSVESIWLDIITKDNSSILMGCMYRSPSQTASQLSYFCDSLAESLQGINLVSTRLLISMRIIHIGAIRTVSQPPGRN